MREVEEGERSYAMVGAWMLGLSNHAALDLSHVVVDMPGLVQTKDHSRKRSSSPKPVCTFSPCAVIYHTHYSSFSPFEVSGVANYRYVSTLEFPKFLEFRVQRM